MILFRSAPIRAVTRYLENKHNSSDQQCLHETNSSSSQILKWIRRLIGCKDIQKSYDLPQDQSGLEGDPQMSMAHILMVHAFQQLQFSVRALGVDSRLERSRQLLDCNIRLGLNIQSRPATTRVPAVNRRVKVSSQTSCPWNLQLYSDWYKQLVVKLTS